MWPDTTLNYFAASKELKKAARSIISCSLNPAAIGAMIAAEAPLRSPDLKALSCATI